VFEAIDRAPAIDALPRRVSACDVCTKEIVDRYAFAAAERPKRQRAFNLRMNAQMAQGSDPKKALALIREAATLAPDNGDILVELARIAHEQGEQRIAYEAASSALKLEPTRSFAAILAAVNASYLALYDDALALGERVAALTPDAPTGQIVRAAALTELARYDEAIAAADAALAINDDAMVVNMKAYALAASGRDAEARAAYTRALQMLDGAIAESPKDADLHGRRAYALLGLGEPKKALAAANAALKLSRDEFLSLQSAGRAQLALGKPKQALAALERAIKSRAAAPLASFHAAEAYAAIGDKGRARAALAAASVSKHFERLAKMNPRLAKLIDAKAQAKAPARVKAQAKAKAKAKRNATPKPKPKPKARRKAKAPKKTAKKRARNARR
jgi:tetratricopeptide (TPR) repeat protein